MSSARAAAAVGARFGEFVSRLDPPRTVLETAVRRCNEIQGAILRSLQLSRVVRVGSFYKGTAIKNASDLDLFVVVRREDVRWAGDFVLSTTLLDNIRSAIVDRYPNSSIGRDGCAVCVSFANGASIDVVPAIFANPLRTGHPLYLIPDGESGWLETSPDAQRQFFAAADLRAGGKLRRAVQVIKAWAHYREAALPLSSFYVETVLGASGVAEGARTYSAVLADAWQILASRGPSALRDPLGISGHIRPTRTKRQAESVARSLGFAADHARCAYQAECAGATGEAVRQWRILLPGFRDL